jgi:hypothetical protein
VSRLVLTCARGRIRRTHTLNPAARAGPTAEFRGQSKEPRSSMVALVQELQYVVREVNGLHGDRG